MKLLMDSLFVAALALGTYYFITEAALRGLDAMLWAHRQFRKWKHRHQPKAGKRNRNNFNHK